MGHPNKTPLIHTIPYFNVNGMPKNSVNNGKLKPFRIEKYDERNAQRLCLEFPPSFSLSSQYHLGKRLDII
jgi:hypothetical protein